MRKLLIPLIAAALAVAAGAHAQSGDGGGGHRGHGGRGRPSPDGSPTPPGAAVARPPPPPKPANQIEIVGVVKAIDADAKSITIAYDEVEALNWPRGVQPFSVYRASLLQNVVIGEKIRFKLDGQRIAELKPF
jgi:hypothetical protein